MVDTIMQFTKIPASLREIIPFNYMKTYLDGKVAAETCIRVRRGWFFEKPPICSESQVALRARNGELDGTHRSERRRVCDQHPAIRSWSAAHTFRKSRHAIKKNSTAVPTKTIGPSFGSNWLKWMKAPRRASTA
jgi:hypothetical protein